MSSTKNFLIVGASSAIGQAMANVLNQSGHQLHLASRHPELFAADLPAGAEVVSYDPLQDSCIPDMPDLLDGLVYCPGSINLKPFARLTEEDFLQDYRINVLGAAKSIQQALPALKQAPEASVVLFSSVAAKTGLGFHASISAAKAGVEGLGRALAAELAPRIRVNVVAPSLTDTPLAEAFLNSAEKREAAAARHPLKEVGDPIRIGKLAAMLLAEGGCGTTGQIFHLDGGLSSVRTP